MTDEEDLAVRVRATLMGAGNTREAKMFGGIGFMLNDNLVVAASRRGLLARVGKERQADALAMPGSRPMVMRGRAMEGYIYADPGALDARALQGWIRLAVEYVRTLPAKKGKTAPHKGKRKKKS